MRLIFVVTSEPTSPVPSVSKLVPVPAADLRSALMALEPVFIRRLFEASSQSKFTPDTAAEAQVDRV